MKALGWLTTALVAGGVAYSIQAGCRAAERAPDARLAGHFEKLMCGIARNNIKTPEKGVRELGHYLDTHARDMFGDFGDMLATIERIPDDAKHDRRAQQARDRLMRPMMRCGRDWNRFGEAISEDPKAIELLERFNERLGRTFEIIFGNGGDFDLLTLPNKLDGLLPR